MLFLFSQAVLIEGSILLSFFLAAFAQLSFTALFLYPFPPIIIAASSVDLKPLYFPRLFIRQLCDSLANVNQ